MDETGTGRCSNVNAISHNSLSCTPLGQMLQDHALCFITTHSTDSPAGKIWYLLINR